MVNSRIRKYPNLDEKEIIENWRQQIQETQLLFKTVSIPKIKIRYEKLATQTEKIVKTLCNFIGFDYQAKMLDYIHREHHVLGGNNGTQFLVARSQQDKIKNPFVTVPERSREYYQQHHPGIAIDLRWREELDPKHQELFEEIAGQVNLEMKWES